MKLVKSETSRYLFLKTRQNVLVCLYFKPLVLFSIAISGLDQMMDKGLNRMIDDDLNQMIDEDLDRMIDEDQDRLLNQVQREEKLKKA